MFSFVMICKSEIFCCAIAQQKISDLQITTKEISSKHPKKYPEKTQKCKKTEMSFRKTPIGYFPVGLVYLYFRCCEKYPRKPPDFGGISGVFYIVPRICSG